MPRHISTLYGWEFHNVGEGDKLALFISIFQYPEWHGVVCWLLASPGWIHADDSKEEKQSTEIMNRLPYCFSFRLYLCYFEILLKNRIWLDEQLVNNKLQHQHRRAPPSIIGSWNPLRERESCSKVMPNYTSKHRRMSSCWNPIVHLPAFSPSAWEIKMLHLREWQIF